MELFKAQANALHVKSTALHVSPDSRCPVCYQVLGDTIISAHPITPSQLKNNSTASKGKGRGKQAGYGGYGSQDESVGSSGSDDDHVPRRGRRRNFQSRLEEELVGWDDRNVVKSAAQDPRAIVELGVTGEAAVDTRYIITHYRCAQKFRRSLRQSRGRSNSASGGTTSSSSSSSSSSTSSSSSAHKALQRDYNRRTTTFQ
mmetsp:Transcript_24379/g.47953  ORF Transcript_24379/g.47953 Transcript_24379/m.47953 type:complete len:201 (+) Transcript_24379:665-1267(+)